jgi:hypothetical protein
MNSNQLISKFISQLVEKQFAYAHSTLTQVIEAKLAAKIKKEAAKQNKKASDKKTKMAMGKKSTKKTPGKTK